MPDDYVFDPERIETLRKACVEARRASDLSRTALVRALEKEKRLSRDIDALLRLAKAEGDNPAHVKLNVLEQQREQVQKEIVALKGQHDLDEKTLAETMGRFSAFTDPTTGIGILSDDNPIALFPLRLETRYRTVQRTDAPPERQFCVRVFPDDVLVDTFQPEIAEAEFRNVSNYWVHRWRAGGDSAGHRAAWASLVRSCGAGRAKWLTEEVKPENPGDEPVAAPRDHILVIRPPVSVPDEEKEHIKTFWERVWLTAGGERDAAFTDLVEMVGAIRAAEIETDLVPVNFRDISVKPDHSIRPVVVFLDLPARNSLPIAQNAWTRGARCWLLPERFVLMGFRNGRLVHQEVGAPISPELQIGPDPSADESKQIRAHGPDLEVSGALRWTIDFEDAVEKGMGFVIHVENDQPWPEFDRLFVLGLRLGSNATDGATELTELIRNHQGSRKGFSLLPQGRATNNTDDSSSGYTWWEDPDESFQHFFETDPDEDPQEWERRKDGAWLAGMLGIDCGVLQDSPNYHGRDQAEARAMNIALWPATLGYYMEQMMEPVFSEETVQKTRDFFNRFVIGRGTVPLVRVGHQPYGILPATVWSSMEWWNDTSYREASMSGLPDSGYLENLSCLISKAAEFWKASANEVAHLGEPGDDPQQTLLDIVGLHPCSVEFYQRYARSFTHYYNALRFSRADVGEAVSAEVRRYIRSGFLALGDLGWEGPADGDIPEILEKIFLGKTNLIKGALVQAGLSDTDPLTQVHADGLNYIAWLQQAACTSHDTLRKQEGFVNGVPRALLYLMLHHSLDLGYIDAALELSRSALKMSDEAFKVERKEPKYIHVGEKSGKSRWTSLYRAEPAVTGDPALHLGDYIPRALKTHGPYLSRQISALDMLKTVTGGALERAFVEHLDCLTYRLDAWLMGMQAAQLSQMRQESAEGFAKGGIYIGAYGWLEHVRPKEETLEPVRLDEELADIFNTEEGGALNSDSMNYGYIQAPSLDHAVTGAILRNGYLANATPNFLAVDLGSERVRLAQQVIEGIANGQSLGALLGYHLERALHDEPNLFLDRLIYDLRRTFPLAGNRNLSTRIRSLRSITKVEARNVVDGAALAEYINQRGVTSYPYDISDLPPLSDFVGPGTPTAHEIGSIIDGHIALVRSIADAVADLQIAESVYQVVRGNYDRASATLDALSKGSHPTLPEVVKTPGKGRTLTHRIALHLEGGLTPDDPANMTPRAQGEPALAQWLAGQLPNPVNVFARVSWDDGDGVIEGTLTPNMEQLGLAPVDLFYMIGAGGASDMPGFDDLLIDYADKNATPSPRHDAIFTLEYKPAVTEGFTLFEVAPLVRALRGLVLGVRPLRPSDLSLQNEASSGEDERMIVRADKVEAVISGLEVTLAPIKSFIDELETNIGGGVDPVVSRDAARDNIDQWMNEYATIVRPLALYGLQTVTLTKAIEQRRAPLTAMIKMIDTIIERWTNKRGEYEGVMETFAALPETVSDEERTMILVRAGRIVSATVIVPLPPTLVELESRIVSLYEYFEEELGNLMTLRSGSANVGETLARLTAFMPAYKAIDHAQFDLTPFRDTLLAICQELQRQATFLHDDILRCVHEATDTLNNATATNGEKLLVAVSSAAKMILGNEFIVLPEFTLSTERIHEWDNVWANRSSLMSHLDRPYPLDDWRIGIARVRDRMRCLDTAILLGDALGTANAPVLEAVQFPFRTGDAWLGLEFPATFPDGRPFEVVEDKLLYSAHFAPNSGIDLAEPDRTYSGLLLDEWIEVVPDDNVATGLSFHFNRPDSEAPQAILLATPPRYRGSWQWPDLVATLHETLDMAKLRAVEPEQLDRTKLGPLLPAIISAVTLYPITAATNFSFANNVQSVLEGGGS